MRGFRNLSSLVVRHFSSLYVDPSQACILQIISKFSRMVKDEENEELFSPVLKEELLVVLKLFQRDKSPEPDRWPIEFFVDFFEIITNNLLKVLEEAYNSKKVPRPINSTFIALIPKCDRPESFDDFRAISLCNGVYKIVTKIIPIRIKLILMRVIS